MPFRRFGAGGARVEKNVLKHEIKRGLLVLLNVGCGLVLAFGVRLAYLLIANQLKGSGYHNPEGAFFQPLGWLLLLGCAGVAVVFFALNRLFRPRGNWRHWLAAVVWLVGGLLLGVGLWEMLRMI